MPLVSSNILVAEKIFLKSLNTFDNKAPLLHRFLPSTLTIVLKEEGADKMLTLFDGESDNPELIWESSMRTELRCVVAQILDACIEERRQTGQGHGVFALDTSVRVSYKKLEGELFIGGVYVTRFLKEPTYNIRDPTTFLEMLMQRWAHELQSCTSTDGSPVTRSTSTSLVVGGDDTLQSVTNASVYICKIRSNLSDKLSHWGYMARCLALLDEVLAKELYGTPLLSIMRILHVAVNSRLNVESLIMSGKNDRFNGIVPLTMRAIEAEGLHKDVAFMLEMLKKLFADALGDMKNVPQSNRSFNQGAYAMAPSPAPGEGPVARNRVTRGNPLDDPLAIPAMPVQSATGISVGQSFPSHPPPQHQNVSQTMIYQPPFATQSPNPNSYGYSSAPMHSAHTPQTYGNQARNMYGLPPTQAQQMHQPNATYQEQYHHQAYTINTHPPQPQRTQLSPASNQQVNQPISWNQSLGYSQIHANSRNNVQPISTQGEQNQTSVQAHPVGSHPLPIQTHPAYQQTVHDTGRQLQSPPSSRHQGNYPMSQDQYQSPFPHIGAPRQDVLSQADYRQAYGTPQADHLQNQVVPSQQPIFQNAALTFQGQQGNDIIARHRDEGVVGDSRATGAAGLLTSPENGTQQQVQGHHVREITSEGSTAANENSTLKNQRNEVASVDARAAVDPKEDAERRMKTIPAASGAASGRTALLQCAILCDLPNFIIDTVLESNKLRDAKDPAAAKVYGIELLKLLTQDPGYGMKFQLLLDENPSWKRYKTQDHSLFITGPEQRADYFLTDGGNGEAKKLLTQN